MLLDLIDLSKLRRAIVYGLLLIAVLILQNMVVSRITLFGVRAVMVPAMVMAVGLFEDGVWGGFVGLAAGYFADLGYSNHVVLFTVLLPAAGFLAGVLGKYMLHKGFLSFLALMLTVMTVITFCQMFRFLFMVSDDAQLFHSLYFPGSSSWAVWRTGLLQILWSLVWAVPIYFPCKLIASRPMGR